MKRSHKILQLLNKTNKSGETDLNEETASTSTIVENMQNNPQFIHQPDYIGLARDYGTTANLEDITNIPERYIQTVIDPTTDSSEADPFSEDDDDSVKDPDYDSTSCSNSSSICSPVLSLANNSALLATQGVTKDTTPEINPTDIIDDLSQEKRVRVMSSEERMGHMNQEEGMRVMSPEERMGNMNQVQGMCDMNQEEGMRHVNQEEGMRDVNQEQEMRDMNQEQEMRIASQAEGMCDMNQDERGSDMNQEQEINDVNLSQAETRRDVNPAEDTVSVEINEPEPAQKGKKRMANAENWIPNKAKKLRNTGKAYVSSSKSKKVMPARRVQPPCGLECKLRCASKLDENSRQIIFNKYWALGDITLQRNFIHKCTIPIVPKIRFTDKEKPRKYNHAFYFMISDQNVRVCKKFFMATLNINDRVIRTVFNKVSDQGFVEKDLRGKHQNHKKLADTVKDSVRAHINSIPRMESHYVRQNTSREFIDGGKCLTDLHADYYISCNEKGIPPANYDMYCKIFNTEYNISFFTPKKDRCELCVSFENSDSTRKETLKEKYDLHQKEKCLSRIEKDNDKSKVSSDYVVAIYDLQAVLQLPRGEVSVFYYKSKLNNFNFTISELVADHTESYLWHEGEALRGADEIGTCVFSFIDKIMTNYNGQGLDLVFYSDNCSGQQKNRFIFSMYTYAVQKYTKLNSITHKYLITGHTQNEADSVHSTIEKQIKRSLKSGPIYVPSQYAQMIKMAKKKGKPYAVNEMSFKDFYSMKILSEDMGYTKNFKITDIKVYKVIKSQPTKAFYKTSYSQEDFEEATITRKKNIAELNLKRAYRAKPKIKDNKKRDLLSLLNSQHIPSFYGYFYNNL